MQRFPVDESVPAHASQDRDVSANRPSTKFLYRNIYILPTCGGAFWVARRKAAVCVQAQIANAECPRLSARHSPHFPEQTPRVTKNRADDAWLFEKLKRCECRRCAVTLRREHRWQVYAASVTWLRASLEGRRPRCRVFRDLELVILREPTLAATSG